MLPLTFFAKHVFILQQEKSIFLVLLTIIKVLWKYVHNLQLRARQLNR